MPNRISTAAIAPFSIERPAQRHVRVHLRGKWRLEDAPSDMQLENLRGQFFQAERLSFNAEALEEWDSGLLIFLRALIAMAKALDVEPDLGGLPPGVRRLLAMAAATPRRSDTHRPPSEGGGLNWLGLATLALWEDFRNLLTFLGYSVLSLARILTGRTKFNFGDLWPLLQECGPRALPIVTLVSFLVGTIIAYMGAVQLRKFGAQIYIADLVGLGVAREMGAIMTGVVVAGRSGAAFAAQLGTMQVNEEIDALRTLGISPIDYLVLPRMLALILMVPLLTLYADVVGILGGMVVAVNLMDLNAQQYFYQTVDALEISDFVAGLIKAGTYGTLIAIAGCMRGMQCGRDAQAVGEAATSAVVTSVVFMVIAAAVLAVVYHEIGL